MGPLTVEQIYSQVLEPVQFKKRDLDSAIDVKPSGKNTRTRTEITSGIAVYKLHEHQEKEEKASKVKTSIKEELLVLFCEVSRQCPSENGRVIQRVRLYSKVFLKHYKKLACTKTKVDVVITRYAVPTVKNNTKAKNLLKREWSMS